MNPLSSLFSWIFFSQFPSLTPKFWQHLATIHGCSLTDIAEANHSERRAFSLSSAVEQKWDGATTRTLEALDFLAKNPSVHCLPYNSPHYPESLKQLSHPPAVLFVKGAFDILGRPQIAIVGSRKASLNGKRNTYCLASQLALGGFTVTSGMAKGIDSAAHQGALTEGTTLGVLGTGIDICYPKTNVALYEKIIEKRGAIVSEFLPGTQPLPYNFPRRNRIVAGLSLGVLVVEAKIRSGSMSTANLAVDAGKEVFAVPGNILDPLSEGVNWLIKQGAQLVTEVADITSAFPFVETSSPIQQKSRQKTLASSSILDSVGHDVTALDDIVRASNQSSSKALTLLLEYELDGLVASVPGGYIRLGEI